MKMKIPLSCFDEAWILMKSAEGKAVIKNMRRIGRSKNNTLALITNLYMMQKMPMIQQVLGPSLLFMKSQNEKIS